MHHISFSSLFFLMPFLTKTHAHQEMVNYDPKIQEVVDEFKEIGVIQSGNFTLKSSRESNYYIDLRRTISRPKLLKKISELMEQKIHASSYDSICGVPYAALSLGTAISLQQNKPLLMARKEKKNHGTKQMVEGIYQPGDCVVIVEDVISSGNSIMETATTLKNEGLIVHDAVVFLDREQGGVAYLKEQGINVHSVLTISELLSYSQNTKDPKMTSPSSLTYNERAKIATHPLNRDLLLLMERKQTNLAIAADISKKQAFLDFADTIGPYICILKMHADIIEDFDDAFIQNLRALSHKHAFFLFEDRKFADIGNTVIMQYEKGVHKIASWAHIINAHTLPGPSIIHALKKPLATNGAGLLLIPQLSSLGALTDAAYAEKTLSLARDNADFVMGFIAQKRLIDYPDFLYFTPGVHLTSNGDQLGQQYLTPHEAIVNHGADVIIVGRGVYESNDIQKTTEQYRLAGWNAYLERVQLATEK